jgi:hypothetical protein
VPEGDRAVVARPVVGEVVRPSRPAISGSLETPPMAGVGLVDEASSRVPGSGDDSVSVSLSTTTVTSWPRSSSWRASSSSAIRRGGQR